MEIFDLTNHEKPVVTLNSNDKEILTEALKKADGEKNAKLLKKIEELKINVGEEEVQLSKPEVSLLQKALDTKWKENYSDNITRELLDEFDHLRYQIGSAKYIDPNDNR